MKSLSAKFHIALGEAFLVVSLLLTALFLGFIPDSVSAIREGRAVLVEALATNSSMFVSQRDIQRLKADLRLVVERNEDILSAGVRLVDGTLLVDINEHDLFWRESEGEHSTDSQLQVSIWAGDIKWGDVELRCRPLTTPGWRGVLADPRIQLILFVGFLSFVVFYFYLAKMLRHLDPSQAIPDRVRSALDTLAEGLLVVDRNGYIVLSNRAFASVVGELPEDLIGHAVADLDWSTNGGASLEGEGFPWANTLRDGILRKNGMICLRDSQSKRRTFLVNSSPVLGDADKPGGVLISFEDVTQLEEKKAQLHRSKEMAEAANRAKSDFLANMSHEIRTPMNSILGFAEILKRGYGTSERESRKYLNIVTSSGKHLLELINDILDLSKVESGRLEVERVECASHRIIREVVQILAVKAQEKNISLQFEADGPIPETILCDPGRLRQIITNLMGNAIKFTEQGGVRVVLRALLSTNRPQLSIEVIDTGVGIPQHKLESIFDPFTQADNSVTRRFGGTGLGLAISRKFAQALGGDIIARSDPGKGSTFVVTLDTGSLDDIKLLQPHEVLATDDERDDESCSRWVFPASRILVVDDGAENRELVKLVLEESGLSVDTAENGKLGLEKALRGSFDLVLMDINMPVMDGFTAVAAMRRQGLKIPVLALTANAMKGFEQQCLEAGYSGYLTKPVDIDALVQTLAKELGAQRLENEDLGSKSAGSQPEELSKEEPHEVRRPLVSRLSEDPRFQGIIRNFVQRLDKQMNAMEKAWREGEFEELKSLAHWLKGAGGTVGFDVFTEPAKNLEALAKTKNQELIGGAVRELQQLAERIDIEGEGGSQSKHPVSTNKLCKAS